MLSERPSESVKRRSWRPLKPLRRRRMVMALSVLTTMTQTSGGGLTTMSTQRTINSPSNECNSSSTNWTLQPKCCRVDHDEVNSDPNVYDNYVNPEDDKFTAENSRVPPTPNVTSQHILYYCTYYSVSLTCTVTVTLIPLHHMFPCFPC